MQIKSISSMTLERLPIIKIEKAEKSIYIDFTGLAPNYKNVLEYIKKLGLKEIAKIIQELESTDIGS